jgi:hypothetical protein
VKLSKDKWVLEMAHSVVGSASGFPRAHRDELESEISSKGSTHGRLRLWDAQSESEAAWSALGVLFNQERLDLEDSKRMEEAGQCLSEQAVLHISLSLSLSGPRLSLSRSLALSLSLPSQEQMHTSQLRHGGVHYQSINHAHDLPNLVSPSLCDSLLRVGLPFFLTLCLSFSHTLSLTLTLWRALARSLTLQ